MDTKPLEIEAESFIKHELLKYNFNVTKPDFDTEGADLLIIDSIQNKFTHFLKIQNKGRTLNCGSHIEIPKKYVEDNFIVFLYVKMKSFETSLFVFFYEDIVEWATRDNKYILSFNENKLQSVDFSKHEFTKGKVEYIKQKLKRSKIKKYTTLIIDGIFLGHAITKTVNLYKEIYPRKQFKYPKLIDIVKNILLMYDNFKTKSKSITCFSFYSSELNTPHETERINKFYTHNDICGNLYIDITDEFVSLEILDKLERTINTENIILVADDPIYESVLNKLKDKYIDITLVMFASHSGRTMFTKHVWGDIAYPIARAIGLDEHEW